MQVWDPRTGKELRRVAAPRGYRGSADYALTTDQLKSLYVPIEGRKVTRLDGPKRRTRIDYNGEVLVWDLATGKAKEPIQPAKGGVVSAYLSPDGGRLVTVERGGYETGSEGPPDLVRLIDTKSGRAWTLGEGWSMAAFSPDGQRVYLARNVGDNDAAVLTALDAQGKELATLDTVKGQSFTWPTVSPDGKHLAVDVSKRVINKPGAIRLYDLATNKQVAEFPSGGGYPMSKPVFSPDGRLLACADYNDNVRLWDVASRKEIRKQAFKGMQPGLHLAFSNDSARLAVPMSVKTDEEEQRDPDPQELPQPRVYLFDLKAGGEPEQIVCPHGWNGGVAFSADDKVLAVGGAGAVHLFDVASGAAERSGR